MTAPLIYTSARVETPKRDVDLFGPTTVRIDGRASPDAPAFPVLYVSAYVEDPDRLVQRVIGALAWLDDTQAATEQALTTAADLYPMPDFVEDVDYGAVLFVAEDPAQTDWRAWAAAMVRRVKLATTGGQLHALMSANAAGAKACPSRHRAELGRALDDAWTVVGGQAA